MSLEKKNKLEIVCWFKIACEGAFIYLKQKQIDTFLAQVNEQEGSNNSGFFSYHNDHTIFFGSGHIKKILVYRQIDEEAEEKNKLKNIFLKVTSLRSRIIAD
ncbi:hypothetical protein BpHYR1_017309 [Brachionus plicatilis]|uniref:Uncharacterized protein n=1 Tax=Brachionus plicatilis TaxID=10195 RepID=A0A3M7R4I2_BRAPC|nr:hypothetical protein BpHYR1_017309 [Brachionus plicatilis]